MPETPAELKEPRVLRGDEFLTKTQFVSLEQSDWKSEKQLGPIQNIHVGEFDGRAGLDVAVVARKGAVILDADGKERRRVYYRFEGGSERFGIIPITHERDSVGRIEVIDIESDGFCEFLARGGIDGAAVFSNDGALLWSYGRQSDDGLPISDLTAGDVDGDGVAEFVACWNGIQLLDRDGGTRWQQSSSFSPYQAEVVDTDNDRRREIVASDGGSLVIRSGTGGEIAKVNTRGVYLSRFTLCAIPSKQWRPAILEIEEGRVMLINFDGRSELELEAPLSEVQTEPYGLEEFQSTSVDVYTSKGVWVKLAEERPEYLVVIADFAGIDRSLIYVYSSEGQLVYHELIEDSSTALAVFRWPGARVAEGFLVGVGDRVWLYKLGSSLPKVIRRSKRSE